jgi:hypothetical protein
LISSIPRMSASAAAAALPRGSAARPARDPPSRSRRPSPPAPPAILHTHLSPTLDALTTATSCTAIRPPATGRLCARLPADAVRAARRLPRWRRDSVLRAAIGGLRPRLRARDAAHARESLPERTATRGPLPRVCAAIDCVIAAPAAGDRHRWQRGVPRVHRRSLQGIPRVGRAGSGCRWWQHMRRRLLRRIQARHLWQASRTPRASPPRSVAAMIGAAARRCVFGRARAQELAETRGLESPDKEQRRPHSIEDRLRSDPKTHYAPLPQMMETSLQIGR